MSAMCGAEGVVHVNVGRLCEFFGEPRIVRLFFFVVADILQQQRVAWLQHADGLLDFLPDAIVHERHRTAQQIGQFGRYRAQGHRWLASAFGPAKVSSQDELPFLLDQQPERRQGFDDARRVGDDHPAIFFLQRHVVIHPHQDAFAAHVQIFERHLWHKSKSAEQGRKG